MNPNEVYTRDYLDLLAEEQVTQAREDTERLQRLGCAGTLRCVGWSVEQEWDYVCLHVSISCDESERLQKEHLHARNYTLWG